MAGEGFIKKTFTQEQINQLCRKPSNHEILIILRFDVYTGELICDEFASPDLRPYLKKVLEEAISLHNDSSIQEKPADLEDKVQKKVLN